VRVSSLTAAWKIGRWQEPRSAKAYGLMRLAGSDIILIEQDELPKISIKIDRLRNLRILRTSLLLHQQKPSIGAHYIFFEKYDASRNSRVVRIVRTLRTNQDLHQF